MRTRGFFIVVTMFNSLLFTFPSTIKIKIDSSIPRDTQLNLQWVNRVNHGNYVMSDQIISVSSDRYIIVPRVFISGRNMNRYDTHGFYISSRNYGSNKFSAQTLFPYNDDTSLTYTYRLEAKLSLLGDSDISE